MMKSLFMLPGEVRVGVDEFEWVGVGKLFLQI
jgi:hypothetical protein